MKQETTDELEPMRDYLIELSFDAVTISGTYERMVFNVPDRTTALALRHALAGDVDFAGGIALGRDGRCSLFGTGN